MSPCESAARTLAEAAKPWITHATKFGDARSVYEAAEDELTARQLGYLAARLRKVQPIQENAGYWVGVARGRHLVKWPKFQLTADERDRLTRRLLEDGADTKQIATYVGSSEAWVRRFAAPEGDPPPKPRTRPVHALKAGDVEPDQVYGRLRVERVERGDYAIRRAHCLCECGTRHTVDAGQLIRGRVKSCGCLRKETSRRQALARRPA